MIGNSKNKSSMKYCADLVREKDHDRYLCSLFAPEKQRNYLLVLLAFNQELAEVNQKVSEPMLGEIRLQWWRDAITGLFEGKVRKHPVVEAMGEVGLVSMVDESHLLGLIDARVSDVYGEQAISHQALINHIEETNGALHHAMGLALAKGELSEEQVVASRAVGTAWGLMGLIRACCLEVGLAAKTLPDDLLGEGVVRNDLLGSTLDENLSAVITPLSEAVEGQMRKARSLAKEEAKIILPALLPLKLVSKDLKVWQKKKFQPNILIGNSSPLGRQWALLVSVLFGNF